MADNANGGGAGLGMVVGALVVIVAVIGIVMYTGGNFGGSKTVDVNIKPPTVSAPAAPAAN